MNNYLEISRVLVIAPLRVAKMTWAQEVKQWQHTRHLTISRILGTPAERIRALKIEADIYIINRENVVWLVDMVGTPDLWKFDMIVIDELSSFKSHQAKRFKALRKVRPLVKRIVGLTGTPTPNGLIDLWPQMYLLDRGERLGKTITSYRREYFVPGDRNWQTGVIFNYNLVPGADKQIYEAISDVCVSMKAKDYLEVPDLIEIPVEVEMTAADFQKYQKFERDLLLPIAEDEEITAMTAGVLSNKLLQMANGAIYDEYKKVHLIHDEKIKALEELVEAANGKPVIVYYNYKHDLARIKKVYPEAQGLETEDDIIAWNQGKIPILCLHPASAGHGLNLQAGGNTIIWFGLNWSLELYQQANARLHRQGQTSKVSCYLIVAKGTIDEDVINVLKGKDKSQEALLSAVRARIEGYREEDI